MIHVTKKSSHKSSSCPPSHLNTENAIADSLMVPEEENKACLKELDKRDSVNMDRKVDTAEKIQDSHDTKDVCVLPGEVKVGLLAYTPAFCHYTQLELSSTDMDHKIHTPSRNTESQSETEEVVPFNLDDTFDYDNVALSHNYPVKSSNCGSS